MEGKISNGGQIWCHDGLEVVAVESHVSANLGQRWNGQGGDVGNSHVVDGAQVGELNSQVWSVGRHLEQTGDIAKLSAVTSQVEVVVDVHVGDGHQIDTIQACQLSIRDDERAGRADTSGEGQLLKLIEGLPLDGLDRCEDWEAQSGHDGQAIEDEVTSNGGQLVSGNTRQVCSTSAGEAAADLLNTGDIDGTCSGGSDSKGSRQSCAGSSQSGGISLARDRGSSLGAER